MHPDPEGHVYTRSLYEDGGEPEHGPEATVVVVAPNVVVTGATVVVTPPPNVVVVVGHGLIQLPLLHPQEHVVIWQTLQSSHNVTTLPSLQ